MKLAELFEKYDTPEAWISLIKAAPDARMRSSYICFRLIFDDITYEFDVYFHSLTVTVFKKEKVIWFLPKENQYEASFNSDDFKKQGIKTESLNTAVRSLLIEKEHKEQRENNIAKQKKIEEYVK